jgi:hypothetical protein
VRTASSAATAALLYHATVAVLLTHELDALKRHEWRVLPLTSWLSDRVGEQVFLWAHVPLVVALLWFGETPAPGAFREGVAAFAVLHVGLHWAYRHHPAYEFRGPSAWGLIVLAGVCGAAYLTVTCVIAAITC